MKAFPLPPQQTPQIGIGPLLYLERDSIIGRCYYSIHYRTLFNPSIWPQLSSPFECFFVFCYLYYPSLLTIGHRHAHTDSVDRWVGCAPHSPCGSLRLLGLTPSSLFWADRKCKRPFGTAPAGALPAAHSTMSRGAVRSGRAA